MKKLLQALPFLLVATPAFAANCGEPLGGHSFCASVQGGSKEVDFGLDCKFVFSGVDSKGQHNAISGTWDLKGNILTINSTAGEGNVTLLFTPDKKGFSMQEFPGENYSLCTGK
jgi:hypothetical protein